MKEIQLNEKQIRKIITVAYLDGMIKGREIERDSLMKAQELEENATIKAKEIEKDITELVRHAVTMNQELEEEQEEPVNKFS